MKIRLFSLALISLFAFSCQKTKMNAKKIVKKHPGDLCISKGDNCFFFDRSSNLEVNLSPDKQIQFGLFNQPKKSKNFSKLSLGIEETHR